MDAITIAVGIALSIAWTAFCWITRAQGATEHCSHQMYADMRIITTRCCQCANKWKWGRRIPHECPKNVRY